MAVDVRSTKQPTCVRACVFMYTFVRVLLAFDDDDDDCNMSAQDCDYTSDITVPVLGRL